jgi:antirestriction protein ArdC
MNRDIYQAITARFIAQLKRGTVPWQKPCLSVQNIVSRKPYRGINSLLLGSAEFQSPFWLTFKQSLDLGGHVKKGEKSTPVIYYKILEKRDDAGKIVLREDGRPARIPFLRWANVFNLDQTEGIQAPAITPSESVTQPHEKAAAIVENARLCPIHHAGFAAYYSPEDDIIRIPAPSIFRSQEDYYHTLYHEMIHASGHISRLNREGVTQHTRFGSERYSKEELIGELGAAFLSNDADILDSVRFENSAAYLASWTRKLESDPRLIVSAASQAQRASDFIRGIEYNEALQECQISPEGMPLTWAQEHGIDTRIPGFGNRDQDGDGGFNLARMEARHQADRPAFQAAGAISVAMKSQRVTQPTLAHPRLDRARSHPSRRRVLAAPGFGTVANQRNFPDSLGFAHPFAPSSPRPDTRLRAQRIGGFTLPAASRSHPLSAPDHCDRLPLSGEPDRPPSALWLANGRHVRAGNGQKNQCFLSRTAKRVDSRAGSGRAFCIADPVHDRLAFADGHFLGVVIERKSALL